MIDRIYGYEIKKGIYQVQKTEAKVVRSIFEDIISGKGPNVIALNLQKNGIPTRKNNGKWTSSMIKQMVRNRRYSGELGYPKIVNKSIQNTAIEVVNNLKGSEIMRNFCKINKSSPFYRMIKCDNCGINMNISVINENYYWRCCTDKSRSNCDNYKKCDGIADEDINLLALEVINELISKPEKIKNVGSINYNKLNIVKIDNQIKEHIKNDKHDIKEIENLIKEKHRIAYAQYDEDYISETMMLSETLKKLSLQSSVTRELLTSLIKEIRIDGTGKVAFILINYQVVQKNIKIKRGLSHA